MGFNLETKWSFSQVGEAEPKGRLLGKGLYSDPTRPVNILVQIETTVTSGQWLSILADEAQGHTYRHLLVPPQTYGSSLEALIIYISVPWLPSFPEQVEMRHLTVQSLGIGTVLNTPHVLPIGGRCAWLHNNTRCKQYTIQSQSLSLLTDSGSCRGKRHKSKATQTHGEKGVVWVGWRTGGVWINHGR